MHGAGGGAPAGERNDHFRHGERTAKAVAERRALNELIREARSVVSYLVQQKRRAN